MWMDDGRAAPGSGAMRALEAATAAGHVLASELRACGVDLSFTPVLDLDHGGSSVIGDRAFHRDPRVVSMLARGVMHGLLQAGMHNCGKHFPGHGSSRADSHKTLADISDTWREIELEPYRQLAKDGLLDAVMIGHLYHPRFSDGARLPASLSRRAITALRAKGYIGFQGVVVSDDMEMGAVRGEYSLEERVIKAVNAGTDLIVFSNEKSHDPELGVKVHTVMSEAVKDGRISRVRIEQAYGRIMLLKRRLMQNDLAGKW